MKACPSPEQLSRLLAEELPESERSTLEGHVEDCPGCQKTLERLTADSVLRQQALACRSVQPGLLADQIHVFFPAMVEIEQVKENSREVQRAPARPAPHLEQIGDYRIVREIGRGGMGVVYEAVQISLGRPVALKVLLSQTSADKKALERFQREARAAGRLHHTNIVPVFGVGVDGNTCFYAMQLIAGQPLNQVVAELRRLLRGRRHRRQPTRWPQQHVGGAARPD